LRNVKSAAGFERAVAIDDLGQCHFLLREFPQDLQRRRQARLMARRYSTREALNIIARTWLGAGECHRNMTRYSRAVACFEKAASLYKRLRLPSKVAYCLAGIAGTYRMTSQFGKARSSYCQAALFFRRGRDLPGMLYAHWGVAEIWKYRGRFARASQIYREVGVRAEKIGHANLMAWALWGQAEVLRIQWRISEASELYSKAYNTFLDRDVAGRCWALEGRVQCNILEGKSPVADIERALRDFSLLQAKIGLATILMDKAVYAICEGHMADAEAILRDLRVLDLPRSERARCALVTAELYAQLRNSRSKRYYQLAIATYRALHMRHAFVAAVVRMLIAHSPTDPRGRRTLEAARREARIGQYKKELETIDELRGGRAVKHPLNLY
jgi:tetratricopeptide (TPR) repeat protein